MSKRVYIYGLGGADKQYAVLAYSFLVNEEITIKNFVYEADLLRLNNPSIEHVYAIDNREGLKQDYQDSIREHSIESCYIFKDILEREGIQII